MPQTVEYKRQYYRDNAKKICDQTKAWQRANPDKVRDARLKNRFGISLEDYNRMVAEQRGLCAICQQTCPSGKNLAVDHDHRCCPEAGKSCGKCVRGLLCEGCNRALGQFKEDPMRLQSAIDYLKEWT